MDNPLDFEQLKVKKLQEITKSYSQDSSLLEKHVDTNFAPPRWEDVIDWSFLERDDDAENDHILTESELASRRILNRIFASNRNCPPPPFTIESALVAPEEQMQREQLKAALAKHRKKP